MSFNIVPLYFGFGLSLIDIVTESLCKYYSIVLNKGIILIVAACILYAVQPLLFTHALKYEGMGITNVIWNVISTALIIIVGVMVFKEKINTIQWVGIFLSIFAIILLSYKNNDSIASIH